MPSIDQRKAFDEFGVGVGNSLMAISAPAGLTALTAQVTHDPVVTGTVAGVGLALAFVGWVAKTRQDRRKLMRGSDWHYLLTLERVFDSAVAASEPGPAYEQFVFGESTVMEHNPKLSNIRRSRRTHRAGCEEISAVRSTTTTSRRFRSPNRNWTTYNYAALWISMAHCIPTYMLSSGLISAGMNWWQALITILLGNTIVLIPILLNSHPGTKYGIPFPVFARAAYGTYGSNLPALMRAIVACGWFGIQAWIGGEALNTFFARVIPGWKTSARRTNRRTHAPTEWLSFLLFWGLNIYIIYRGMDLLRKVENWAAPFVLIMTALLLGWAIWKANGLGYLLTQQSKFHSLGEFWPIFIPSLTGMIGFWATLSLNMPDFTRFGHSQREQAIGQVVALPTTMTVFAAMGVMITSAAVVIYPHMKAGRALGSDETGRPISTGLR